MSDIINTPFQNPMDTFLKMSAVGSSAAQQQAAGAVASAKALEAQAGLETARIKAEQDAAKQAKTTELLARISQPGAKYQDYLELSALMSGEQATAIREAAKLMRQDEQDAALAETARVFSAFKLGRPDLAVKMIRDQAAAERSAGNEQGALLAEEWARMVESGPEGAAAVAGMLGYQIALLPGGDKAIEAVNKVEAEYRLAKEHPTLMATKQAELDKAQTEAERSAIELKYAPLLKQAEVDKYAADLGLTGAQKAQALASARKLDVETQKALLDITASGARPDGLPPDKVFTMEKALRDEYQKRTAVFNDLRNAYETIRVSSVDNSGAGDIALVTAFMKMLDPGSVVREGEFDKASNTSGLLQQMKSLAVKVQNGQFLSPEQRTAFAGLAKKYMDASAKYEKETRTDLENTAKYWNLVPDNVFGVSRSQAGFGTSAAPAATKQVDY